MVSPDTRLFRTTLLTGPELYELFPLSLPSYTDLNRLLKPETRTGLRKPCGPFTAQIPTSQEARPFPARFPL